MFGKMLYEHGTVVDKIARSRMEIDQARLLVLSAALQVDLVKAKGAMKDIGMAKVRAFHCCCPRVECSSLTPRQAVVPTMAGEVIDRAAQVHGAEGISRTSLSITLLLGDYSDAHTLPRRGPAPRVYVGRDPHAPLRRCASQISLHFFSPAI